jgi:hypothetical protein
VKIKYWNDSTGDKIGQLSFTIKFKTNPTNLYCIFNETKKTFLSVRMPGDWVQVDHPDAISKAKIVLAKYFKSQ